MNELIELNYLQISCTCFSNSIYVVCPLCVILNRYSSSLKFGYTNNMITKIGSWRSMGYEMLDLNFVYPIILD